MANKVPPKKIKEIRSVIGLSQQQLSSLLNVSSSTIERWEREGAMASSSASWKNLEYLLNISRNEKIRKTFLGLLENGTSMFLAQSFLFGLGPILTVLKFESGGDHLVREAVNNYKKILRG